MPKKISFFLTFLLLIPTSTFAVIPSLSDDFPGKGDRFAWSNALPYYNLANKYLGHGRFEEAKTNFEEAIYRYEYDPDFYINYGVALRKLESYTAAEEAFKKAIELRNNDWQAWSNLANAYLKENRLKDTIACFQKAMKMQPPPPPLEKEAMLKDIADINRILSMQAPPAAQTKQSDRSGLEVLGSKKSGRIVSSGRNFASHKKQFETSRNEVMTNSAAKKSTNAKTANAQVPAAAESGIRTSETPAAPASDRQSLKKSGWDWVQQ